MEIGKLFIIIGGMLLIIGLVFTFFPSLPFPPRLPGDIYIKRDGFTFYFPIVTSIIISIILSIIAYLFFRK
ncbi:MAG: hypothetical protein KatS3mg089_0541 [Patescibacteria group bacterium]|nr:MAG: hypothetical protein KatS3mg089_0541 [Patescibacteria group bacterium]